MRNLVKEKNNVIEFLNFSFPFWSFQHSNRLRFPLVHKGVLLNVQLHCMVRMICVGYKRFVFFSSRKSLSVSFLKLIKLML
uniref:Uncharacterized protein n=1 Tax=Strigamia maritima TaxID=126957 RepID=T1IT33_STRMM